MIVYFIIVIIIVIICNVFGVEPHHSDGSTNWIHQILILVIALILAAIVTKILVTVGVF